MPPPLQSVVCWLIHWFLLGICCLASGTVWCHVRPVLIYLQFSRLVVDTSLYFLTILICNMRLPSVRVAWALLALVFFSFSLRITEVSFLALAGHFVFAYNGPLHLILVLTVCGSAWHMSDLTTLNCDCARFLPGDAPTSHHSAFLIALGILTSSFRLRLSPLPPLFISICSWVIPLHTPPDVLALWD